MRALASIDQIAFAELNALCRNVGGSFPYPPNGAFVQQDRGGRSYWYFKGYQKSLDGVPGHQTLKYVGAVADPAIDRLAVEHEHRRSTYRKRRDLAARLRRSGLPTPQPTEGAIAGVLADLGLFEAGSVLVGSVAFQTYGGMMGVRLTEAGYRTEDMDVAQPLGLRMDAQAGTVDLLPALKVVDVTFEPIFHSGHSRLIVGYKNRSDFKIEFLTPMRGGRDGSDGRFVEAAGLPGVGAQTLKFLEFLLKDPVTSIVLHDAGVSVTVPDPMRYVSHKLMVSVLRRTTATSAGKAVKDVRQAETLIEASVHARTTPALGGMWLEAWNRGPKWRRLLREGTLGLAPGHLKILAEGTIESGLLEGTESPFLDMIDPRRTLLSAAMTSPASRDDRKNHDGV